MSKANPYDGELSPRRKLFSQISFFISTALVIAFIIWVIVKQPANVRTRFAHVEGNAIPFSQTVNPAEGSEFSTLYAAASEADSMTWNPEFQKRFPTAAALLNFDESVYSGAVPYTQDRDGYFTLALAYDDAQMEAVRHLDVLMLPYRTGAGEAGFTFTADPPLRYTLIWDSSAQKISQADLRTDKFRLNFYTLTLTAAGTPSSLAYSVGLNDVVSLKEAGRYGVYDLFVFKDSEVIKPVLTQLDSASTLSAKRENDGRASNLAVTIRFNDFLYDYFDGAAFTAVCEDPDGAAWRLGLN